MTEPTVVTVRTLLAHFRSTLETARQTGEPVVIALRRRKPTAVLLGYEVWQALALRQTGQADTAALQAELREGAELRRAGSRAGGSRKRTVTWPRRASAWRSWRFNSPSHRRPARVGRHGASNRFRNQRMDCPRLGPSRSGAFRGTPKRRPGRVGGSSDRNVRRFFRSQKWCPVSGCPEPARRRALTNGGPPPTTAHKSAARALTLLIMGALCGWREIGCVRPPMATAPPFTTPNP